MIDIFQNPALLDILLVAILGISVLGFLLGRLLLLFLSLLLRDFSLVLWE